MSTSAVVLFALVALSLTPAADAKCSGTIRNKSIFCPATGCTEAHCCEYKPNTCSSYHTKNVAMGYTCQLGAAYNSANAARTLALGTTVAQYQADCCYATAGTCGVYTCTTANHQNTAAASKVGNSDAACCTENPKCSAYTCPAGYTAANAGTYAASTAACCTVKTGTCRAWFVNGGGACAADHSPNTGAYDTTGATNAICCSEDAKCAAYKCPTGYTAANANSYGASTAACCTVVTGTCEAYRTQTVNPYSCPTGYNDANAGSTVTNICKSTFLSTCCTAATACASYTCPTSGMRVKSASCKTTGGVNTCADDRCCENAYNTCANPATAGLACSAGTKVTTTATGVNSAPCTQADYQRTCCVTYPTCSSYSCPGGYNNNAALDSTACTGGTCTTAQCCTQIPGACNLHTCGTGKTLNSATLSNVGASDDACCTALPLCSDFTCTASITTGKNAATYGASNVACCTADTTKCYGSNLNCPEGYYSIAGNAAATNAASSAANQDTFNTNCCLMTELCTAYWYATGTASSAVALRPALVTVVIGAIAGLLM